MRHFYQIALGAVILVCNSVIAFAEDYPEKNFPLTEQGTVDFSTPSGNIECVYMPNGESGTVTSDQRNPELWCDRDQPDYVRFVLRPNDPAEIVKQVEDPICCGGVHTLSYGRSFRGGPFYCESAETGLDCMTDNGHGFHISKKKIKAY